MKITFSSPSKNSVRKEEKKKRMTIAKLFYVTRKRIKISANDLCLFLENIVTDLLYKLRLQTIDT